MGEVVARGSNDGSLNGIRAVAIDIATGAEGPSWTTKSIPVSGTLDDNPKSIVRVLLGDWGIYGIIVVDGIRYDLYPNAPGTQHVKGLLVDTSELQSALPDLLGGGFHTMALTTSTLAYYADVTYQSTHPDWFDRIASAFQQMDSSGMWQTSIVEIDMALPTIYYLTGGGNVVTSTSCGTGVEQFRNWLASRLISGVTGYVLWSSNNFDSASTYACASTSDSLQSAGQWTSAVAEGTNHCCDLYNANSAYERGIVSGHELAHLYGEENHPGGCNWWPTNCNIMHTNIDNSGRKFYFEGSTKNEIRCRFYYGLEYGVNC